MKREELIRELRTCANCTLQGAHYCPDAWRCAQHQEELMAEAADVLEGLPNESAEQ